MSYPDQNDLVHNPASTNPSEIVEYEYQCQNGNNENEFFFVLTKSNCLDQLQPIQEIPENQELIKICNYDHVEQSLQNVDKQFTSSNLNRTLNSIVHDGYHTFPNLNGSPKKKPKFNFRYSKVADVNQHFDVTENGDCIFNLLNQNVTASDTNENNALQISVNSTIPNFLSHTNTDHDLKSDDQGLKRTNSQAFDGNRYNTTQNYTDQPKKNPNIKKIPEKFVAYQHSSNNTLNSICKQKKVVKESDVSGFSKNASASSGCQEYSSKVPDKLTSFTGRQLLALPKNEYEKNLKLFR